MSTSRILPCALAALAASALAGCGDSSHLKCTLDSECGTGSSCVGGVCKACPSCAQGQVCLKAQCLPSTCGDRPCGDGRACVNGVCADGACLAVTCPAGQTCAKGSCYPTDCPDLPCESGEICWSGVCRTSLCQGVQCAGGETCAAGQCISESCAGVVCGAGTVCLDGSCQNVRCVGVICPSGSVCVDGRCASQGCGGVACPTGFACVDDACVDAQCAGVDCAAGTKCRRGACFACEGADCPARDAGVATDASSVAPDAGAPSDAGEVAPDAGVRDCSTGCGAGLVCVAGACQSGCWVGPGFHYPGASDPADPCKACQPMVSTSAFTTLADGAACGRGSICVSGSCVSGCLVGSTYYPAGQADPATSCRSCQPLRATSWWSSVPEGTSCGPGVICILGVCQYGCWIDSPTGPAFYPPWALEPANACLDCEPWVSVTAWTASNNDGMTCGTGKVCSSSTCRTGCWIDSLYRPSAAPNPGEPCQLCEPSFDTHAWSGVPNGTNCGLDLACGYGFCQAACSSTSFVDQDVTVGGLGTRVVALSSNANWMTYLKPDLAGINQVWVASSGSANGYWTPEQVSFASQPQGPPSIAIDSSDNLHVAWSGPGWGTNPTGANVQYRRRTAFGVWDGQVGLTDQAGACDVPAIAVDSRDDVHVVWTSDDLSVSHRRGKAPCALADWDPVEHPFVGSQAQSSAALAVDASDNLHVAWTGRGFGANPGASNIQYLSRVGAIWSSREPVTDLPVAQAAPSIAVDTTGGVHVAWAGLGWGTNPLLTNIQHGVRTASTGWSVEAVTDQPSAQSGASVALDARDSVFVSWLGDVGMALVTTQYSERQAGIWSLPTIVESAGTGWAASLWWASRPVVRGQRTNVVTIGCVLAFAYLGGSPTVPEVHYYGACANPT